MIYRKRMWSDHPNTEWQEYLTPFELRHGCFDGDGGGDSGGDGGDWTADYLGDGSAFDASPSGPSSSHDDGMGGADIWGESADSGGLFSGGEATSDFDGDVSMTTGDLGLGGEFNYGPSNDPEMDPMNEINMRMANTPGYTPSASLGALGITGTPGQIGVNTGTNVGDPEDDESWRAGWDLTERGDGTLAAAGGLEHFGTDPGGKGTDYGAYDDDQVMEANRLGLNPGDIERAPFGMGFTLKGANINTAGFGKGDLMGRDIGAQITDTLGLNRGANVSNYLNPVGDPATYVPYASMFDQKAPISQRLSQNFPAFMAYGTGPVQALAAGLQFATGDTIRGTIEDEFGRSFHVHNVAPGSIAESLGFEDGYLSAISPEDEIGYVGVDDGNGVEFLSDNQVVPQAAAPAAAVERLTEPAGLNLTGTDAQKLAQLATIGVAGGTGQGVARSEEGQNFFKQLVRDVYGDAGELVAAGNVRPIELQYLQEVMGGISEPEVSAFLRAIG